MLIHCEHAANAVGLHDLEAHRVGEAQTLIAVPPKPPVHGSSLELTIREDHTVSWILVKAIQESKSFVRAAKPCQENPHLGDDQVRLACPS